MVRKKKNKKRVKIPKIETLKNKAWRVCSDYIRMRDKYVCFTCKKKCNKNNSNAGHFQHGKNTPIYLHEKNVHCQCVSCNLYYSGRLDVYLRNIQKKYGVKVGDWLMKEGGKKHKYTVEELENIIDYYKQKIDKL
jgi:hypothetical protein